MSVKKSRITITIDPRLEEYLNDLVDTGKAPSVSAAIADALTEKVRRDRRALALVRAKAAQADPERVARMMAHIESQIPR